MSSPQSYQFTTASVIDSGLGATGELPTPGPETAPIPEPAALWTWLGLAMLGGMVTFYQLQTSNLCSVKSGISGRRQCTTD